MIAENKDRELFDRIADTYSQKDTYPPSSAARKFLMDSLIKLAPKKNFDSILEVGCGPGYTCVYLKGRYKEFLGLDYAEKFIEIANGLKVPNAKFMTGNIKDLSFLKDKHFDLIFGLGILHHVDDIDIVLKNIRMLCDKNTTVAFLEPFSGNPIIQVLRFFRKKLDKDYNDEQGYFSKKEVVEMFERNGFKLEKIRYQGYFSTPFANVIIKPLFLFNPICKLSIALDKFLQDKVTLPLAWNIIWTARVQDA